MGPRTKCALVAAFAASVVGVLTAAPLDARAATSRTVRVCSTKTVGITGWSVYTVCLTAADSYDGLHATGYVAGVSCNVYMPTGAGWACQSYGKGSYWNASRGAWEDWLNFALVYRGSNVAYQNCVYLRVDTKPSGSTSYQDFTNQVLPIGTAC
jgi:hypothetical protein